MAEDILKPLYPRLLAAEQQYKVDIKSLEGLEKVVNVLGKLNRARDEREIQGEDVEPLEELIESSNAKLQMVLDCMDENKEHSVNLCEWASEIQADLYAHDPLRLSLDSDGDSNSRFRRNRLSEASSRGAADILAMLQSNGKLKENEDFKAAMSGNHFFFLTTLAWSIAVIGTLITIGFLSADFWYSQQNMAIQIERSAPTPLELPAITLCSDLQNIPTFVDYPTPDFPGLPLFGITTYIRFNRSSLQPEVQVTYPATLSNASVSPIEDVIVSKGLEKCSNARKGFNVDREMRSRHWIRSAGSFQGFTNGGTNCLHCFRIGYKRRELLQPYDTNETAVLSPAVQIKVFKSRMFEACQAVTIRRDPFIDRMFAAELELFAKDLDDRGILDFNGHNYSVLNQTQRDIGHPGQIDFFCNTYFFSGFFYPSLDNASISYRYEPETEEKWVKSGNGPYYSVYSWEADDPLLNGPHSEMLERDTYATSAIRIFAEEAATVNSSRTVLSKTSLSVLDSTHSSIFTFRRVDRHGKNEFEVKKATSEPVAVGWRVMDEYYLGFDYETFETEIIMMMATMSWPEYITDVFEFVGLFTGICIFTLIIVPAHSFGFRGTQ